MATACDDFYVIRLWDVSTGEDVAELQGHEHYVHAVNFSPDGTQLVSCLGDYTIRLLETPGTQRDLADGAGLRE